MSSSRTATDAGDRLAKVMARSGLCSRRDAETWIAAGRVSVNGVTVKTPAFNVTERDRIEVDGAPLAERQGTRVWLYHKPAGLVVTEKDPEGRPTVFETLSEQGLPRVVSIGRLDINTEGLLLLTNDGGLKRVLELPATGWLRRYRVRAHGTVTQAALDRLREGTEIDGVRYGPIEATLEREQGANVWLVVALREGKNREVKNVLAELGLQVNRLIRVSYGPFQLGDLPVGGIETVKARVLREQLGKRLAEEADVDFESELPERQAQAALTGKPMRERTSGRGTNTVEIARQRFRFTDRAEQDADHHAERPRQDRPGRFDAHKPRPDKRAEADAETGPPRKVHFEDGREPQDFVAKTYGKKPRRDDKGSDRERPKAGGAKPGSFGDRARGDGPPGNPSFKTKSFKDKGTAPRREGAERPKRAFAAAPRPERSGATRPSFSDKPPRFARDNADRPQRDPGDRVRPPLPRGGHARPDRDGEERPRRVRTAGEGAEARPPRTGSRPPRGGDRPAKAGARPIKLGDRSDKKPFAQRPAGDKPARRAAPPKGPSRGSAAPRGAAGAKPRKPGGAGGSRGPGGSGAPRPPRSRA